jgi:hypothetical protein
VQQPPIRNSSIIAAFVCSHSGELGAGVDPALVLVDPDATGGSGGDGPAGINKIDITLIDHVRDWQPEPGSAPPPTGNDPGGDTVGRHLP